MVWNREQMAQRAAKELKDGYYVNLGIGMPTMVANYIPKDVNIWLESENGLLGIGEFPDLAHVDPDLTNASKQTVTAVPGASFYSSSLSFGMIRGGHIDVCIIGAMQVSENGDIASWMIPNKLVKGMGGAMDLVAGVKQVIVLMEQLNKHGQPKLLKKCDLPLTGKGVVDRVITEFGVYDVSEEGLKMIEIADGVSFDEVQKTVPMTIINALST